MTAPSAAQAASAGRKPAELVGIQYLRGFAAMMVVTYHLEPQLRRVGYHGFWPSGLAGGVDLFFVISGFIMWTTTAGRGVGPLLFWQRRIARIVPLYWLATAAMVLVMLIAPGVLQSSRFDAAHVAASFLFVPWDHPVLHLTWPVVIPGWTLNYEMFFYLVFGLFLLAPPTSRLWGSVLVLIALTVLGWVLTPTGLMARFYTNDVMLEFAGGIVLGSVMGRSEAPARLHSAVAWALIVVGIGYIVVVPELTASQSHFLTMGIGAMVAVAGMIATERGGHVGDSRTLRMLGDASYSIYLSQQITIAAVAAAWRRFGPAPMPGGRVMFCLFTTIVTTLAGIAIYILIERRLVRWFRPAAGRTIGRVEPDGPGLDRRGTR